MDEDHTNRHDMYGKNDRKRAGDIDTTLVHIVGGRSSGRCTLPLRFGLVEKARVKGLADGLAASRDAFVFHGVLWVDWG
jgi:hypothetical protein